MILSEESINISDYIERTPGNTVKNPWCSMGDVAMSMPVNQLSHKLFNSQNGQRVRENRTGITHLTKGLGF